MVARQYNVSRSDLLSSRRTANVVRPRQVAMYLAKTLTLRFTRFGQFWNDVHQSSQQAFRAWVEGHAPWLWNSVVRVILDQPVFAVMGILGIVLMLVFRPRKPLIGYARN